MRAGAMSIGTEIRQATPSSRATCATARPWLPSVAVVSVVSAGSVAATVRSSSKVRGTGAPGARGERAVDGPAGADDLERRQPQPLPLVLDPDLTDAQPRRQLRCRDQRRRGEAREGGVERLDRAVVLDGIDVGRSAVRVQRDAIGRCGMSAHRRSVVVRGRG